MTHQNHSQPDPDCQSSTKPMTKVLKGIGSFLEKQRTESNCHKLK